MILIIFCITINQKIRSKKRIIILDFKCFITKKKNDVVELFYNDQVCI